MVVLVLVIFDDDNNDTEDGSVVFVSDNTACKNNFVFDLLVVVVDGDEYETK